MEFDETKMIKESENICVCTTMSVLGIQASYAEHQKLILQRRGEA